MNWTGWRFHVAQDKTGFVQISSARSIGNHCRYQWAYTLTKLDHFLVVWPRSSRWLIKFPVTRCCNDETMTQYKIVLVVSPWWHLWNVGNYGLICLVTPSITTFIPKWLLLINRYKNTKLEVVECKNVNDLYDLDLWPIDLDIVHDTSSPPGLYSGHMWI